MCLGLVWYGLFNLLSILIQPLVVKVSFVAPSLLFLGWKVYCFCDDIMCFILYVLRVLWVYMEFYCCGCMFMHRAYPVACLCVMPVKESSVVYCYVTRIIILLVIGYWLFGYDEFIICWLIDCLFGLCVRFL